MKRLKIIIDTDPGVDDAAAILMALVSPELDVLGISVVAGNVALQNTVVNACKIVNLSGRHDVPVYAGAAGPLVRQQVYGKYAHIGAFDDEIADIGNIKSEQESAVDFIIRSAKAAVASGEQITLCSIGPMTNVALALIQHPDVRLGIKQIVSMGGAFTAMGHRTPWAEFNIYADPHAADIVFKSGIPIILMPLDMTFQALLTQSQMETFRAGGKAGQALFDLFTAFDRSDPNRLGREGGPVHDATVIAWLIKPELFKGHETYVGVQITGLTMGYTYADFYNKLNHVPNALVMTEIDEEGFLNLLTERIAGYGAVHHKGEKQP
ncbi:nucleoside hydrolase [Ochrobactrum sp. MR28]|nr:nucleoside hydrolase [Ochrobactrum sp. MR28]MBX8818069.1 nucleoside hydrolase [Ochrobactrum sp. MR31]